MFAQLEATAKRELMRFMCKIQLDYMYCAPETGREICILYIYIIQLYTIGPSLDYVQKETKRYLVPLHGTVFFVFCQRSCAVPRCDDYRLNPRSMGSLTAGQAACRYAPHNEQLRGHGGD